MMAASVILKIPLRMPPRIKTGSNKAKAEFLKVIQISRPEALPRVGQLLRWLIHQLITSLDSIHRMPGTTPAKNEVVLDWPVSTAPTINGMEGGMMGATTSAAAMTPPAKPGG